MRVTSTPPPHPYHLLAIGDGLLDFRRKFPGIIADKELADILVRMASHCFPCTSNVPASGSKKSIT